MTPCVPRLFIALVASVASFGIAASNPEQARLLVSIVVDGLDNDYLQLLRDRFGEGGFRRLEREGAVILNVDYGPGIDAAAATATLMSGASPSTSGIGGAARYDREAFREVSVYAAPDGGFTSTAFTPATLRVSTVADEARIAAGGVNVVYAVAPSPEQAIALAGHAANTALWLDVKSGNWTTSSYYKEMPVAIATRNRTNPLTSRLDTMSWTPSLAPADYPAVPEHLARYPFRYVFPRSRADRLDMFEASPLVNREVTLVASDILRTLKVGQHEGVTDVLNLGYSLKPFTFGKNPDTRVELMDAYVKLDRNLEQLFADIDSRVGAGNSVIMLAATPPANRSRRDDEQWGIPFGEFSTRRAASLLNMYLIALYGNGEYVTGCHRGQFYLNHKLLQEKSLNERTVRTMAAAFLIRMHGVDRVYTLDQVVEGTAGEQAEALRRNTVVSDAGDLLLTVAPGYELVDDYHAAAPAGRIQMVERSGATTAPVFILAPGVDAQTIGTVTDARAIAPTVCRILRIRSPNGASAAPVHLKKK